VLIDLTVKKDKQACSVCPTCRYMRRYQNFAIAKAVKRGLNHRKNRQLRCRTIAAWRINGRYM